mmetsp:Transcript_2507/g.7663  ORF Transcript_2507/g.7663 Transcript_2507/m.7663 type:complete len:226 (+) Transcript_2507:1639-2316(+)
MSLFKTRIIDLAEFPQSPHRALRLTGVPSASTTCTSTRVQIGADFAFIACSRVLDHDKVFPPLDTQRKREFQTKLPAVRLDRVAPRCRRELKYSIRAAEGAVCFAGCAGLGSAVAGEDEACCSWWLCMRIIAAAPSGTLCPDAALLCFALVSNPVCETPGSVSVRCICSESSFCSISSSRLCSSSAFCSYRLLWTSRACRSRPSKFCPLWVPCEVRASPLSASSA